MFRNIVGISILCFLLPPVAGIIYWMWGVWRSHGDHLDLRPIPLEEPAAPVGITPVDLAYATTALPPATPAQLERWRLSNGLVLSTDEGTARLWPPRDATDYDFRGMERFFPGIPNAYELEMAAVRMERIDFFEALAGGIRFFRDHPRRLQVKKALNRTASAVAFLETDERRVIVKWRPENNLEIQMYNGDATFGQLIIYEHEGELPAPPELPDMVSVLLATHLFTADATIGEEDLTALIDQRFGVAEPSEEAATSPQN